MKKIPYGQQYIDSEDVALVSKALKGNLISTGQFVNSFEKKIKSFFNCKHALSCNSGTSALHLAFLSIPIKKNDVAIIPAVNFVASLNILNLLKAKVYFADVDPETGQMNPQTVLECIKKNKIKKVKLLVTMFLGGYPNNAYAFYKLKKILGCLIVEDACHALGSSYNFNSKKIKIGSCMHSDIAIFSLHPIKTLTTGEGGLVATNNDSYANKIKLIRSHGIERNPALTKKNGMWFYDIGVSGFNFRMSDINCALGISQLKKIHKFIKKRNSILKFYIKQLDGYKGVIKIVKIKKNEFSSCHLILCRVDFSNLKINKKTFFSKLAKKNIFPQVNYIPLYKFKLYKENSNKYKGLCKWYSSPHATTTSTKNLL